MLSLALSMVLYGLLVKSESLGGSDGFNMGRASFFGLQPGDSWSNYANYAVTVTLAGIVGIAMRIYFDSTRGLVALAARDNEIRVEYLGSSVRGLIASNFVIAAFCGGLGASPTSSAQVLGLAARLPTRAFGPVSHSVLAAFIASTVLEIVRSFSSAYFPNSWQLVLGLFLLAVIRFLPSGIGSLWTARYASTRDKGAAP